MSEENIKDTPPEESEEKPEQEATPEVEEETAQEEEEEQTPEVEVPKDPLELKDEEIARLQGELQEAKDQYVRNLAEMENFKRRKNEESKDRLKYASSGLAREVIQGLDHLELALGHANAGEDDAFKNFLQGIEMVMNQLYDAFEKQDIKRIYPLGEKFDPTLHEAVAMVESDEVESDHVAMVMQAGYLLHDRVIRPARVQVCKKSEKPAQAETAPE